MMNGMMNVVVVDDGRYLCQPIMDGADRLQVCFASPLGELRISYTFTAPEVHVLRCINGSVFSEAFLVLSEPLGEAAIIL